MELSREYSLRRQGLLYPMMVIAAIAVIVFSIVGIAAVSGWMPIPMLGDSSAAQRAQDLSRPERAAAPAGNAPATAAFQCAECGVIESIREIERRSLASGSLARPTGRPLMVGAADW